MSRYKASSGDYRHDHPYLKGIPAADRQKTTIKRHPEHKWVEIYQNGVLIFSNKKDRQK